MYTGGARVVGGGMYFGVVDGAGGLVVDGGIYTGGFVVDGGTYGVLVVDGGMYTGGLVGGGLVGIVNGTLGVG